MKLCSEPFLDQLASVSNRGKDEIHPYTRKIENEYEYEYEYEYGREDGEDENIPSFGDAKYKVLTTLPKFLVAKSNAEKVGGWRLASYAEVKACHDDIWWIGGAYLYDIWWIGGA